MKTRAQKTSPSYALLMFGHLWPIARNLSTFIVDRRAAATERWGSETHPLTSTVTHTTEEALPS